ncbi:bifunctional phosphopantothenoylcysteine decarboxylase/phosphopantothenate--cysteine ligase CoaBC [Seminibacterium arietis]|uniref:Coenzyme A biosynthesis bifunctional protein CoaBC n=1 Tax=Seminibacterium arietis TaxID=1173502 RepID=A0ABW3IAS1_9PAST
MCELEGKRIVVGISAGIAAYKSIELIRLLRKARAEVRVALTPSAIEFVTPLTLQAISSNPVYHSLLDPQAEAAMGHIELAKWADFVVIAPATADFIARLTVGMANDLLSTLCLATPAPILLAPAMNQQMYQQTVTQQNLVTLKQRGVQIIGPNAGEQACGDVGFGRMAEPHQIFTALCEQFQEQSLAHLTVTITAGPTREALDPVRYISNHSSGKMGFAIAEAFARLGATVNLVAGPVHLPTPLNVNRIDVVSAIEMEKVALNYAKESQIFVGCAAVADYRAEKIALNKIKKTEKNDELTLRLVKNPDIVANIAALEQKYRPFVVGFAAETEQVAQYAQDKLKRKNLDLICANDVSNGLVFNSEQNELQLFWQGGSLTLPRSDKKYLATQLVFQLIEIYNKNYCLSKG